MRVTRRIRAGGSREDRHPGRVREDSTYRDCADPVVETEKFAVDAAMAPGGVAAADSEFTGQGLEPSSGTVRASASRRRATLRLQKERLLRLAARPSQSHSA